MVDIKRTPILIFVLLLFVGAAQAETLVVPAGGDVQAAVNTAKPGDTIILEAGAGYIGPLTLPNKTGTAFITIQSSALALLPAGRITPAHSALLPKIYTPGSNFAALQTAPSAHHYRFIGIEFAPISANVVVSDLVKLGDGSVAQNSLDLVPHHLVLDRVYVHGYPTQELKRGIALNSAYTDIINSYISDVHGIGYDTQAICGWNGPGPFRIINNYLEAAGENLMFGGDDARIEALTPADVEIRQNYFFKPLTWKVGHPTYAGKHWTIKNLLETKNVRRIVIDGNMFENNWPDAQVGYAILIKSNNQEGTNPWAATLDLTYTNNAVKNSTHGLNIMGIENPGKLSGVSARLKFINNLWLINGIFLQGFQGAEDVILDHNTVISTGSGSSMSLYSTPVKGFVFTNNIIPHTGYGVKGDGVGEGVATLNKFAPGYVFRRNLMAGARVSPDGPMDWPAVYPTDNFYPESLDGVFVDLAGGNYRIASPLYKTAGTDGKALGCDIDQLLAAQGGGVVSIPTPTPTPSPSPTPTATPTPLPSPSPTPTPAMQLKYEVLYPTANSDNERQAIIRNMAVQGWICQPNPGGKFLICHRVKQ